MSDSPQTTTSTGLFDRLNNLIKREKPPEKRLLRHAREREIIDIALSHMSQSPMAQELIDFMNEKDIQITVLRGRENRDYAPSNKMVYISVVDDLDIHDPEITIHMIGAIRESIQEYDPHLRRITPNQGESLYVHREGQKFEDKMLWQTGIVYELGKMANKDEFIDSFTLMGYCHRIQILF